MKQRTHDERGSVSTWLVTASLVMAMLVGLAVDLGGQIHAQQRAHDLAAQAARVGGEQLQAAPAIQGRYVAVDTAAARRAATSYLRSAGVSGSVAVRTGDTVAVTVRDTYETRFLGIIGISRVRVTGTATAHPVRSLGGTPR
ncbi:putative membrane protein [Nocardioidaceae bacterium Broad-1]|nr:putative membrane protein [Nocardioidaceae bacterium Broad-1]